MEKISPELLLSIADHLLCRDIGNLRSSAKFFNSWLVSLFRAQFHVINVHFERAKDKRDSQLERFAWVAENLPQYVKKVTIDTECLLVYTTISDARTRKLQLVQSEEQEQAETHYWNREAILALETAIAQDAIRTSLCSFTKLEELHIRHSECNYPRLCSVDTARQLESLCSRLSQNLVPAMANWRSCLKVVHILNNDSWSGAVIAAEAQTSVEIASIDFSFLTDIRMTSRIDRKRGMVAHPWQRHSVLTCGVQLNQTPVASLVALIKCH